MKNLKNLNLILIILLFFFCAFKYSDTKKKTTLTVVTNSALSSKKVIDTYIQLGYEVQSITTQLYSIDIKNPNLNSSMNYSGGLFEREYLIILTKY